MWKLLAMSILKIRLMRRLSGIAREALILRIRYEIGYFVENCEEVANCEFEVFSASYVEVSQVILQGKN